MKQVGSVCVCPTDFNRHSLPVYMRNDYDADKALAQDWNRNAEEACCPRKLKSRDVEAAKFLDAALQFSFAGIWEAQDRSVRFLGQLVKLDDCGLFHLPFPSKARLLRRRDYKFDIRYCEEPSIETLITEGASICMTLAIHPIF